MMESLLPKPTKSNFAAAVDRRIHTFAKRDAFLIVRLTLVERNELKRIARKIGVSLSDLVRHVCARVLRGDKTAKEMQREIFAKALAKNGAEASMPAMPRTNLPKARTSVGRRRVVKSLTTLREPVKNVVDAADADAVEIDESGEGFGGEEVDET